MKQIISALPIVFLFLAMLFSPKAVFEGAESGLLLWFQIVFPTLFPFMLISGLMLAGGGINIIARLFGRMFSVLFATSKNGAFAVITGFLCGYPMGAKVSADLVRAGRITQNEGAYLLSFCNNTSPVFIMNFIVWKTLGREDLMIPTLLILVGVPVFLSLLFRRFYLKGEKHFPDVDQKDTNIRKTVDFTMLDACLTDSFECRAFRHEICKVKVSYAYNSPAKEHEMSPIKVDTVVQQQLEARGITEKTGVFGEHRVQLGTGEPIKLDSIKANKVPYQGFRTATKVARGKDGVTTSVNDALHAL